MCSGLTSRRQLAVATALGLGLIAGRASAQGMMDHVDFSSPKWREADLGRADVEALIAKGGPVVLADRSLNGVDLSGLDLTGADLRWARLNRANLAGTRLDGARLDLAWAVEADLTEASLKGASLFQAQLLRAKLDRADLSGARIVGSFENASLVGVRLRGAEGSPDMRNQSMGLMRAVFRLARMQGADLTGAKLARADLEFAKLQDAVLRDVDLERAKLGGANLSGADLAGANLAGADVASAIMTGIAGRADIVGMDQTLNRHLAFFD